MVPWLSWGAGKGMKRREIPQPWLAAPESLSSQRLSNTFNTVDGLRAVGQRASDSENGSSAGLTFSTL